MGTSSIFFSKWYVAIRRVIKYDGWYRMHFETQEICEQYANRFNSTPGDKIKGVCELSLTDELK